MPLSLKIFIMSILALVVAFVVNMMRSNTLPPYTEYVLTDGMKITAKMPQETIVIEGRKGTRRFFKGENWSTTATLTPRPTRWYGSLGLYDPADSYSQNGRLLVDEGRQFFSSKNELLRYICYLTEMAIAHGGNTIYTNKGLIVSCGITSLKRGGVVRDITIWQAYVNGERPTSLEGANDSAIHVSGGVIPETATPHPAEEGEPRQICTEKEFKDSPCFQKSVQ